MQRKWRKRMVLLIENAFLEHPQLDQMYQYKSPREKYVGVQSWKAAHLPTLEIRVEPSQKERKMGRKARKERKK